MRPAAPPLPQPARPPPTPADLERGDAREQELQAALDAARFHSRRPAAGGAGGAAARWSAPAEPAAYEARPWGAPQFAGRRRPGLVEQRPRTAAPFDCSTDDDRGRRG